MGGTDSEKPRIFGLSIPYHLPREGGNVSKPYETIAEGLEEAARREAEHSEKFKTPGEKPSLSEPALKTLLDESGEITPERYVAQAGGTPGAAIRQLDLACAVYGWKKRKVGFSVIYGPGEAVL
ncbi:MAG: hypothetical protein J5I35_03200 [Methanothrix harundinacea]|nr:hypothetical protein [Methanothrix harundinacea]